MSDPYTQQRATSATVTPPRTRETYYDVDATTVINPTDRIRWGAVLAGLFSAMAAMVFFTVLGLALGLAALDPNQPNNWLAAGTSIYGIITGLLSFAFGGFVAARTAAVGGAGNGFLHGAMVWITTTVLTVTLLGSGLSMLLGTTLNAAGEAAGAAVGSLADDAADAVTGDPNAGAAGDTGAAADAGAAIQDQAQQAANQVTPQQLEQAADTASQAAWWTLLGMGVTALAAIIGGVAGARRPEYRVNAVA